MTTQQPTSSAAASSHPNTHNGKPFLPDSTIQLLMDKQTSVTSAYAQAVLNQIEPSSTDDDHKSKDKAVTIADIAQRLFYSNKGEKVSQEEGKGWASNEHPPKSHGLGSDIVSEKINTDSSGSGSGSGSKLDGILAKLHLTGGGGSSEATPHHPTHSVGTQDHVIKPTPTQDREAAIPQHHHSSSHFSHEKKHGYDLVYPQGTELSRDDLERTAKAGGWVMENDHTDTGTDANSSSNSKQIIASELFLQMVTHSLAPLTSDPLSGLCSPSLLLSSATIPLTIVSVIPDIMHHHASVIVRARKEIFLATNYWEASGNAKVVTDALRELSRRVVEEKREKVVVKVMYDRGE